MLTQMTLPKVMIDEAFKKKVVEACELPVNRTSIDGKHHN